MSRLECTIWRGLPDSYQEEVISKMLGVVSKMTGAGLTSVENGEPRWNGLHQPTLYGRVLKPRLDWEEDEQNIVVIRAQTTKDCVDAVGEIHEELEKVVWEALGKYTPVETVIGVDNGCEGRDEQCSINYLKADDPDRHHLYSCYCSKVKVSSFGDYLEQVEEGDIVTTDGTAKILRELKETGGRARLQDVDDRYGD